MGGTVNLERSGRLAVVCVIGYSTAKLRLTVPPVSCDV